MKKKAVFMSPVKGSRIYDVYTPEIIERMRDLVELYPDFINKENLDKHKDFIRDVEVAFSTWGMPALNETELEQYFPNLKAVFYAAGSVQYFARPFLRRGISVISAWAANAIPVAEYAAAQILLANKGFFLNTVKTKKNYQDAANYANSFPGNYSVKIGILGAGMIGSKVIEFLKPFNLEILVFDPFLPEEKAMDMGVLKAGLEEIFSTCQTISNHIANLPETVGMLNKEHFSKMLTNATFINTGRGAQVVEADLIDALKKCPDRTAVLDVTDPEPVREDSELLKLENVFLTSHIAGSSGRELARMSRYMLDEFIRFEKGEELKYSVTLKMLETMA